MIIDQALNNIRERISKIFDRKSATDLEIFKDLHISFPKDIKIEQDVNISDIDITCFAEALGLANSNTYLTLLARKLYYPYRRASATTGVQSYFISYLLKKGYLKKITVPSEGCLVLYSNYEVSKETRNLENVPKHAGILEQNAERDFDRIVRSRCGNFKAILRHRLWYVDIKYGSEIEYYQPLNTEESEKYFQEYLISLGVLF